tara:strand:- start:2888 stop:8005 length:5118 start_codon:yes stop_codon:yes gene_type:complete
MSLGGITLRKARTAFFKGFVGALATGALVVGGLVAGVAPAAVAAEDPATVTADALPTVQINGVAWDQAIAGNTVFAGGEFTRARPAGSPAGANESVRSNLLAYNLTTGALIASFAPTFNGTVRQLAVTPDGSKLFVVGSFTQVNGSTRNRVAVFDLPGMTLSSVAPNVNGPVDSVAVTNTVAYFGGNFSTINGQGRTKFGAVTIANNSTRPISAAVGDGRVQGIALSADASRVAISGTFVSVNGTNRPGYGLYMMDTATGASLDLPVNNTDVRNAGTQSGVRNLDSDGVNFYGVGWHYSSAGTTEGVFAVSFSTGALVWMEDCHGDSYDVYASSEVVYAASHKHYCSNNGGFPETFPRSYHHSTALTKTVEGVNGGDLWGYPQSPGKPSPALLNWFPDYSVGTYTGQSQATWAVTGNDDYVVYGGEFMSVNGQAQQGLVRFAKRATAPNSQGPRISSAAWDVRVTSEAAGTVHVSFPTNWDRDDKTLVYRVYRDSESNAPILTQSVDSTFWQTSTVTAVDRGLTAGSSPRYRVTVTDSTGNVAKADWTTVTVSGSAASSYVGSVLDSGPASWWRLGETSGTSAASTAGGAPLLITGSVVKNATGAISGDNDRAMTFSGASSQYAASTAEAVIAPDQFSTEAWIRTTTTRGGKIIGFGDRTSGSSSSNSADRHLYMSNNGELFFGVRTASRVTVSTPSNDGKRYNDGAWHHVVTTMGADGMKLYVDGELVGSRAEVTYGRTYNGYWRVGGDQLSSWSSRPSSDYFAGTIDEVAVYRAPLTATEVQAHYVAGTTGTTVNQPPAAAFTSAVTDLSVAVDGRGSSDVDGTVTSYTWQWGDSTPDSTGATATHNYAAAGTYQVRLTVRDDAGAEATLVRDVTVTAAPVNQAPTAAFTSTASNLSVEFDGRGSSDTDGSVASYAWQWGDGTANGAGSTPTHAYAAAGTYQVTLTVRDDDGAEGTVTQAVTVTAPPPAGSNILANDAFERSASGGWGSADQGGAWTLAGGNSAFSVSGGTGKISTPRSTGMVARLGSVSSSNTLVKADFSLDKILVGQYVIVHGRTVGDAAYSVRLSVESGGAVRALLLRGSSTAIGSASVLPGVTLVAGQKYTVSFEVSGVSPTNLKAKLWQTGTTEPDWQKTGSDSALSMQSEGSVAVESRVPGSAAGVAQVPVVVSFDSITVTDPTVTPGPAPDPDPQPDPDPEPEPDPDPQPDPEPDPDPDPAALTIASDAFERTSAAGWGSADQGGAWTLVGGNSSFSVSDGDGNISTPRSTGMVAKLDAVASTNTRVTAEFSLDKILVGQYVIVHGRTVNDTSYSVRLSVESGGAVRALLLRGSSSAVGAASVLPGVTLVAGQKYTVSFEVSGVSPTNLKAKLWQTGTTEPDWQKTGSDSTAAMQAAGSVGVESRVPGSAAGVAQVPVVVSFESITVTDPTVAPPAAAPPAEEPPAVEPPAVEPPAEEPPAEEPPAEEPPAEEPPVEEPAVVDPPANPEPEPEPVSDFVVARDAFERAVSGGWGTSDLGGDWSVSGGNSAFAVTGGAGTITTPLSSAMVARLGSFSSVDTRVTAEFSVDKVVPGQYIVIHGRSVTDAYSVRLRVEPDASVRMWLLRGSSSAIGASAVAPGVTITPGAKYTVSLEVTGTSPTTLRAKLWTSGSAEPDWQMMGANDVAEMQVAGAVAVESRVPGNAAGADQVPVVLSFHDITVIDPTP